MVAIAFVAALLLQTSAAEAVSSSRKQATSTGSSTLEVIRGKAASSTFAAFRARLQQIKDAQKRKIVEHIVGQLEALNKRLTDHYLNVLDKLSGVLNRIRSRADKVAADGFNVLNVQTAISDAERALNDARTAVITQAGKSYDPTVLVEAKLKDNVKSVRQAVRDDLNTVLDAVKAARSAVQKAAVTLAQIPKVDEASSTNP